MPEQKPKPELLPCPKHWCRGVGEAGWQLSPTQHMVKCSVCKCATPYFATKEEASDVWNTRPVSELERLAREVAKQYRLDSVSEMTAELSDPIDEMALYFERFAGPSQKGKV